MCVEGETRGLAVGAEGVVGTTTFTDNTIEVDGKLPAGLAGEVGHGRGLPGGEALWVAKVAALVGGGSAVEVAKEVELFGWVVLVDVCVLEEERQRQAAKDWVDNGHTDRLT